MGITQSYFRSPACDSGLHFHSIKITSMNVVISPKNNSEIIPNSEKKCLICMENTPDYIITTCWHKCLCHDCGIKINSCPVCRKEYDYETELKKVFDP